MSVGKSTYNDNVKSFTSTHLLASESIFLHDNYDCILLSCDVHMYFGCCFSGAYPCLAYLCCMHISLIHPLLPTIISVGRSRADAFDFFEGVSKGTFYFCE